MPDFLKFDVAEARHGPPDGDHRIDPLVEETFALHALTDHPGCAKNDNFHVGTMSW